MDTTWITALLALQIVRMALLALLAGAIGLVWGFAEIIGAFKNETGRALRTGGAWLVLLLNFAAAALTFLLAAYVVPAASTWLAAVACGLAWPTILRNTTVKLVQPLQPGKEDESFALHFERAYGAVQALALQFINASLTRQRMKLVTQATAVELAALEEYVRLAVIASPLPPLAGESGQEYIDQIIQRDDPEKLKKAYLAMVILQFFDRAMLIDMLRETRKKAATPAAPLP